MLKTNYHTHTYLCNHASGNPSSLAKRAIELGFSELGISDHGPMPRELEAPDEPGKPKCRNMNVYEFYNIYLKEYKEAYSLYHDKIKLYLGLETEYAKEYHSHYKEMKDNLDYMILGLHWFYYKGRRLNTYSDMDNETIYAYKDAVIEALKTGLYEYLAHPDLFFINYNKDKGGQIWDKDCENVSREIIEACIKYDIYIEINANGPNNSRRFNHPDDWLYPNYNFWRIASEYKDLKIIVGADAHNENMLITPDTRLIYEFIDKLGLKVHDKMIIK